MMVAFDATMLILLFDERAAAPIDPATGERVTHCQERIQHFVNTLSKTKGARIIIPTPALSEFLVRTKPETVPELLAQLQQIRGVQIAPFAIKAAVEFADMQRILLSKIGRRRRNEMETHAKAKFDQQIVAIAKAECATAICSDDQGLGKYATRFGLAVVRTIDLPLSPESAQGSLILEPPEPSAKIERDE